MPEPTTEPTPAEPTEPTPAETKTFTQEDVNKIVQERLRKLGDVNELRKKATDYDRMIESQKSEHQKLTERLAEYERKAQDAETRALRLEVASAKGLTAAQAKRLQGGTREELEQDADEILEILGSAKPGSSGGRPKAQLNPVLVVKDTGSGMPDMDAWMRNKSIRN